MVEGDGLRYLDGPCRCGADLALYGLHLAQRLVEVYPHDGLQVGQREGPEGGYTLMK